VIKGIAVGGQIVDAMNYDHQRLIHSLLLLRSDTNKPNKKLHKEIIDAKIKQKLLLT